MTPNEIRGFNQNHLPPGYPILETWVQEIAAQLAEVNESLKYLAHPLLKVEVPTEGVAWHSRPSHPTKSGELIDIHGPQVRVWAIGDRILVDSEMWVVNSKDDNLATLRRE
jgi:hypothetical protein